MGFAPDTVERLYQAAEPVGRPFVGALAFSQREVGSDGMGGWATQATPTVFDWAKIDVVDDDGKPAQQLGFAVRWDYPPDTLIPVAGTGCACVLVHRRVFELVQAEHGPVWYDRVPNTSTGQIISEDLSFCLRVGALGVPMWVHTGVRTTHLKSVWLTERDYAAQRTVAALPVDVPIPAAGDGALAGADAGVVASPGPGPVSAAAGEGPVG
jgi:hypothetical protein